MQGIEIHAPVTILAEGCRGHLSKQLIKKFELDKDSDPQTYGIGMKELWQVQPGKSKPGLVQHTTGWPLDSKTYGGSFHLPPGQGPHRDRLRLRPGLRRPGIRALRGLSANEAPPDGQDLLEGGEILSSGARAIVEGGYQSLPKTEMPGALLIGDAAGTLNVPKIKGTHQAMRCGMLAAEHIAETSAWRGV